MGSSQIIITTGTALTRQEQFRIADTGILTAASVITDGPLPRPGQAWAEFGLMIGGRQLANRQAILGQGYIGTNSSLGWQGKLSLQPTTEIYLFVWSSVQFNIRLAMLTE